MSPVYKLSHECIKIYDINKKTKYTETGTSSPHLQPAAAALGERHCYKRDGTRTVEPVIVNRALFEFPRRDVTPPDIHDNRTDREILTDIINTLNNQLCAADHKYFSEFLGRDISEKLMTNTFYATRKTIDAARKRWMEENENNPDVDLDRFLKKAGDELKKNHNDAENDRKLNEIMKEGDRKVMAEKLHAKVLSEATRTQIKASNKSISTRKAGRTVNKSIKQDVKNKVAEIMSLAPDNNTGGTEAVRLSNLGELPHMHGAVGSSVYSMKCIRGAILLDSGASHNCLPLRYLESLGIPKSAITRYKKYILNSIGGNNDPVTIMGEIVLTVVLAGPRGVEFEYTGVFLVLDSRSISHPLLSVAYVREGEGTIYLSKYRDYNRLEIDMINTRTRALERTCFPLTSKDRITETESFNEEPVALSQGQTADIRMLAAVECGASLVKFNNSEDVNIKYGEFSIVNSPCDWSQDRKFYCFKVRVTAKKDMKYDRGEFEVKCTGSEKNPQNIVRPGTKQPAGKVMPDIPAAPELTENMEEDGIYHLDPALQDAAHMEYRIHSKNQGLFSDPDDVSYINKEKRKFDTPHIAELSHLTKEESRQVQQVLDRYPDAIARGKYDVGHFTGFEVPIVLKPNAVISERPRNFSREMQDSGDVQIDEMLDQRVVEHAYENVTKHRSNLHIVHKPASSESHGSKVLMNNRADKYIMKQKGERFKTDKFRVCTDFRILNGQCESAGRIVLPSHQEVRQRVRGKYVNQIDLSNGYFNMPLTEESRAATTFYWRHRGINKLFRFRTCTMGWINSSYWFQEMVQYCLRREHLAEYRDKHCPDFDIDCFLSNLIIYSDDILTLSSSRRHSIRDLDAFIYCMNKCNIKINAAKSSFATQEFIFLGHHFCTKEDEQYSCMTHSRAAAIVEWRCPSRSLSECFSRLSVISWYCNLIPALKLIAARLFCLLAEKNPVWNLETEKCWNNIKFLVTLGIKLSLPDNNLIKALFCDSSCVAWAANLFQLQPKKGDRMEHLELISCFSRLLGRDMMSRAILNKEQHTITAAVKYNESYIRNSFADCFVCTDASVTVHILRAKQPNCNSHAANFESCAIYLSTFSNIRILNICGSSNALADFLSRSYLHSEVKRRRTLSNAMCEMTPVGLFEEYQVLSNDLLRSILLGQSDPELIDCSPREYKRAESRLPKDYLKYMSAQTESDETEIFRSVLRGFGSINIDARIWEEYVNQGRLHSDLRLKITEPKLKAYIKRYKLGEIRDAVKKLPHIYGDIEAKTTAQINFAFVNNVDEMISDSLACDKWLEDDSGLCPTGGITADPALHRDLTDVSIMNTEVTGWVPHNGDRAALDRPLNDSNYANSLRNWFKQVTDLATLDNDVDLQSHLNTIKSSRGAELRRREMSEIMKILHSKYKLDETGDPGQSAQLVPMHQEESSEVLIIPSEGGIDIVTKNNISCGPHSMLKIKIDVVIFNPTRYEPTFLLHIDDTKSFSKLSALSGLNSVELRHVLVYSTDGVDISAGQSLVTISNLAAPHSELKPGHTRYLPVFVSGSATMCGEEREKDNLWAHITDLENIGAMTVQFTELADENSPHTSAGDRKLWRLAEERGAVRPGVKHKHCRTPLTAESHSTVQSADVVLETVDRAESELERDPSLQEVDYYPTNEDERKELNRLLFITAATGCKALLSPVAIKNIQRSEPWIRRIAQSIEAREASLEYHLKDGVLYRQRKRLGAAFDVMVLPAWLIEMLAESYHKEQKDHNTTINSAHYQQNSLREMLSLHYYSKNLDEICADVIRSCNSCRLNQLVRRKKHHGLQRTVISTSPNAIQCADVISGLPNSTTNCTNMLLVSDRATGMVFGAPLRGSLTSGNILRALLAIWGCTDAPRYFLTDHGSVFGAEVDSFMKKNGINHIKNSPTRSQATDTESRIRVAREYLLRSVETWDSASRREWDKNIMFCLIHMNRTLSRGSDFSKYDLHQKSGRYYTNPAFDFAEDEILQEAIQKHLDNMIDRRENVAGKDDKSIPNTFKVGQLITEPIAKTEHKVQPDGSRALQNNSIKVFQIMSKTPTVLRCLNLINGNSKNVLIEKAKKLTIPQKIQFNSQNESVLLSRWRKASQKKLHGEHLYKMIRSEDEEELFPAELGETEEEIPDDDDQEYDEVPDDPALDDTGEPEPVQEIRRGSRVRKQPVRYGQQVDINLVEFGRNHVKEFYKDEVIQGIYRPAAVTTANINYMMAGKMTLQEAMDLLY